MRRETRVPPKRPAFERRFDEIEGWMAGDGHRRGRPSPRDIRQG